MKTQLEITKLINNIHKNKIILIDKYIGANKNIKFKCNICNNIWITSPSHIINNKSGCPKCRKKLSEKKRTKTQKQFIKEINNKYTNIKVKSLYINSRINVEFECEICNTLWKSTPSNILKQYAVGCSNCYNFSGGYSESIFISKPGLKNKPAKLYFYKFWNKKETFYKTGITINKRKFSDNFYYNIKYIKTITTTLYDAFLKEKQFIKDFSIYKFGGHTECFKEEIYNVMFPKESTNYG